MIEERPALNLEPKDKIQINGEWWTVLQHSINTEPFYVGMYLSAVSEPERGKTVFTVPMTRYNCEPHCC